MDEHAGDAHAQGLDDIEVQGVSAQKQQSVIQRDQDTIIQHEDEGVSVQMPPSVVGVQVDGRSISGDGLGGVQCVQGQMK